MNANLINRGATFVAGFPRSGTTLMTALLDNHPELLVFPEECMYLEHPETAYRDCQNLLDSLLTNKVRYRLQGTKNFIDEVIEEDRNYKDFDYKCFEKKVNKRFKELKKNYESELSSGALGLISLVGGYQESIGKENYFRWVVKNPKYELHWEKLLAHFPSMKLILMLRDPRDAILSRLIKTHKKRYLKKGGCATRWRLKIESTRLPMKFLKEWESSLIEFHRIRQHCPDRVLLVRYEDLVSERASVMKNVSEFLEIEWSENLRVPSFLGRPWKGNSAHQRMSEMANASKIRKKYQFASHQLWQIEAWIGDILIKEPAFYALSGILEKIRYKALFSRFQGDGGYDYLENSVRMWLSWRRLLSVKLLSQQQSAKSEVEIPIR